MESLALALLALPVLAFAGYPAAVLAAARLTGRRPPVDGDVPDEVVVLICAHNEAARIGEKLATVISAIRDTHVRVIVADDGSTDDTAAVVERFADDGVALIRLPRGGKAAALNAVAPRDPGTIVVMTDADPLFEATTLPALLAPFADPHVGAVAGHVATRGGAKRFAAFDALFRRYESAVRQAESDLFGCTSADGGLYAIRAHLIPVVPPDVTDDFYISTAAVAAGHRIAFAADARVTEQAIAGGKRNFRRRIRITVRGLTALWSRRRLMNPFVTGWYAPALFLHKVARRLAPLAMLLLWPLSAWLAIDGAAWAIVFAGLSALMLVGLVGSLAPGRLPRLLTPVYAVALHLAGLAAGAALFASGRRYAQWTPQKDAA